MPDMTAATCTLSFPSMRSTFAALLLGCLFASGLAPGIAAAQDQTGTQERPVLPEIAPREVEIRGQLEISFPSMQRPALVGFNPPPLVASIPAGRRPFVEEYRQNNQDLPLSPLRRPDTPMISALAAGRPAMGELDLGGGTYFSRYVRGRLNARLTAEESIIARIDYNGSDGHLPGSDIAPGRSSFDLVRGEVGLQSTQSWFTAGFSLDGTADGYTAYAAALGTFADDPFVDHPERRIGEASGRFFVRSAEGSVVPFHASLRYGGTSLQTRVLGSRETVPEAHAASERRLEMVTGFSVPFEPGRASADIRFVAAGMDEGLLDSGASTLLDGGASFQFRVRRAMDLRLGARVISLTRDAENVDRLPTDDDRSTYFAPDVRVDFYPVHGLQIYAYNRPGADANTLGEVLDLNAFVVDRPDLQATVRTIDAESGVRVFFGSVQLGANLGAVISPNYLYFETSDERRSGGYEYGFFSPRYDDARILQAGANIAVTLPGGLSASSRASIRRGRLSEGDAIPFFSPFVSRTAVGYMLPNGRGLVQAGATIESARYRERVAETRVGDYVSFDLSGMYNINRTMGVVVKVENLSAGYLERWDRYPEAPGTLSAGFRLRW
jgi:hypothetical protein